jgi:nucleotide-binding universal stress UspA family protein
MKTLLVATDFSSTALNAANYAVDMALAIKADIYLFHAFQPPHMYSEVPVTIDFQEFQKRAEKEMELLKNNLDLRSNGQLQHSTEIKPGNFYDELNLLSEKIKPYVVIIGSQGTSFVEQLLFGSHAVFVMKHLKWPVISVSPGFKFSSIKKIGLATDFSNVIDTVPIDEIKILVKDFGAELHILNVGKKDKYNQDVIFGSGLLQELLNDVSPNYHIIANKNTDESIVDFAVNNQIDLLIILPKSHDLIETLTHKSHTKQLVLHSFVPVMALHK